MLRRSRNMAASSEAVSHVLSQTGHGGPAGCDMFDHCRLIAHHNPGQTWVGVCSGRQELAPRPQVPVFPFSPLLLSLTRYSVPVLRLRGFRLYGWRIVESPKFGVVFECT